MIQHLVKQFTKTVYPIINYNLSPCGRDTCYCLRYLDLKDVHNKHFYESCFRSWYHKKDKNNH